MFHPLFISSFLFCFFFVFLSLSLHFVFVCLFLCVLCFMYFICTWITSLSLLFSESSSGRQLQTLIYIGKTNANCFFMSFYYVLHFFFSFLRLLNVGLVLVQLSDQSCADAPTCVSYIYISAYTYYTHSFFICCLLIFSQLKNESNSSPTSMASIHMDGYQFFDLKEKSEGHYIVKALSKRGFIFLLLLLLSRN